MAEPDAEPEAEAPPPEGAATTSPELPVTFVSRPLAAAVLVALLAAGALSAWLVLRGAPPAASGRGAPSEASPQRPQPGPDPAAP